MERKWQNLRSWLVHRVKCYQGNAIYKTSGQLVWQDLWVAMTFTSRKVICSRMLTIGLVAQGVHVSGLFVHFIVGKV